MTVRRFALLPAALALVSLVLLVAASWALRFVGHGTFPAIDALLYFLPLYEETYGRVAAGELPLWNPYQLCGEPWLGVLQAGLFYPGHVLYLLLPLTTAYAASGVLHLVVAALATVAFCRRAGLGTAAANLAAVVFTLRGRMSYALIQLNFLEAAAWLPLGALAVLEIVRGSRRLGTGLLAVATGLSFLAGYPQATVYMAYAWSLLLVALLVGHAAPPREWAGAIGAFVAGGMLGGLTAAVQLVPAAELARFGTRALREVNPDTIGEMSIITPAPWILATGAIAGNPHAYGVIVLALVAAALVTVRHRPLAFWAIAVAVLSALFALAGWGPLFRLYLALPLIGWFRYPHRILVLTDFGGAIAAAIGLDAVMGGEGTARPRRAATVAAACGILGVVLLARGGHAPAALLPAVLAVAVAGLALVVLALLLRGKRGRFVIGMAITALAVAEISRTGWHGVRLPYTAADILDYQRFETQYRELAARAGPYRAWLYGTGLGPSLGPKLATRYRLRVVNDYEPLNTGRQAQYFRYLSEGSLRVTRPPYLFPGGVETLAPPPGVAPPATRRRLLDLAAMRFFALPAGRRRAVPAEDAFLRDGGLQPGPPFIPSLQLYENPHVLPRAFVTYRTRTPPPPEELLARLARADFDPLLESYVEEATEQRPPEPPPRGQPATIVYDGESVVEIDATLALDGIVVLADAFYPGWDATVDGLPAPIYATNHLFRGVPASRGTHRVRFEYRPRSLMVGALLSLVGVLVTAGLLLQAWPPRAARDPTSAPC